MIETQSSIDEFAHTACTIEGEPSRISMCNCLECQRRTGAVISNQARFRREQVTQPRPLVTALRGRFTRVGSRSLALELRSLALIRAPSIDFSCRARFHNHGQAQAYRVFPPAVPILQALSCFQRKPLISNVSARSLSPRAAVSEGRNQPWRARVAGQLFSTSGEPDHTASPPSGTYTPFARD